MKRDFKKEDPYKNSIKSCFLSNYPPKECGIATFTKDLSTAMDKRFNPKLKSKVIALNAPEEHHDYEENVIFDFNKEEINKYIQIAKKLNQREDIKIISVQHEFGIFGGEYGSHLIYFLDHVKKPVVITFHSVLPNPDDARKEIVKKIAEKSSAIIVMAKKAVEILSNDYGIPQNKIHVIHHGIPSVEYLETKSFKEKLNLTGKKVLSTFGLMSRGKGIEYMIKALPALTEKYPDLIYLIIGETHPVIKRNEGETYRNELINLVKKLKLENHVKFCNRYLDIDEITDHLLATDIYICTNLEKNQITSGTLAYAMGCGKALVSTKNLYAEEMLADDRGIVVDFKNPNEYSTAIDKILSDSELKKSMQENAYSYSRQMIWPNVALRYLNVFNKVTLLREETTDKFPRIKLDYLSKMTDNYGIFQFSNHSEPDKSSGYTLDDNSRALVFSIAHDNLFNSEISHDLSKIYLNFLEKSQEENGNFKNHHFNQEEKTNKYSEDSFGRTIWALGYTFYKSKNLEMVEKAKKTILKSMPFLINLDSPRSKAFVIKGLYYYYKKNPDKEILQIIKTFADNLIKLYNSESSEKWQWFESCLTYGNAILPNSLLLTYELTKEKKYLEIGEITLKFLSETVFINNEFYPIGQNGWYNRSGKRALFDQQPIDASYLVQTYLFAYKITKNNDYYKKAIQTFNWFLGKNYLKQMMYNESTGGCYDGLGKYSLNLNQGAESTVSYLLARIFLEETKFKKENLNPYKNFK